MHLQNLWFFLVISALSRPLSMQYLRPQPAALVHFTDSSTAHLIESIKSIQLFLAAATRGRNPHRASTIHMLVYVTFHVMIIQFITQTVISYLYE